MHASGTPKALEALISLAVSLGCSRRMSIHCHKRQSCGRSAQYATNRSTGTTIVQNDTRWNGLRAWMPYLGFARVTSRWDIDPTDALRDTLPEVFGSASRLIAAEFLERAASTLPVLDGGKYRQNVESVLKESSWPKPEPGSLSTSLSRALLRLEREGTIKLEQLSDTGKVQFLSVGTANAGATSPTFPYRGRGAREMLDTYWPKADAVNACIKNEAETADVSVLLAVHQPTPLIARAAVTNRETAATEKQLLDFFLSDDCQAATSCVRSQVRPAQASPMLFDGLTRNFSALSALTNSLSFGFRKAPASAK